MSLPEIAILHEQLTAIHQALDTWYAGMPLRLQRPCIPPAATSAMPHYGASLDIGALGMVSVSQESAYLKLLRPFLERKATLGVDGASSRRFLRPRFAMDLPSTSVAWIRRGLRSWQSLGLLKIVSSETGWMPLWRR
ncbi:hypothetical protein ASPCAL10630 [Aspergillus calidoustus]|uniref:Uncharacterized protein n=1 Tax=Aspergillus calidoustus TaxID=454130 RepID=A0A0U5G6E0_ASPCI|nr:hypothetical protein ASPCAL10630 [Aspergillus calidoustus]